MDNTSSRSLQAENRPQKMFGTNSKSLLIMKNSFISRIMCKSVVFTFALLFLVLLTSTSQAQDHKLTFGGGGGLSFQSEEEQIFSDGGIGYNAYGFLLYNITPNISAGAGASWIFGDKVAGDEASGNIAFYMAKGRYYLCDKKGRLYGGFNVGLSSFSFSFSDDSGSESVSESLSGFAFGPEIGFALGWGNIGANYDVFLFNGKDGEDGIQGSIFSINLGFNLDFIARE